MYTLKLSLLGSPQNKLNEEPLTGFTTNKAQALLFYLAVTGQPHTRHALATLLWSDASDQQARKNLRNTLFDLRALIGPYLNITPQTVGFNQSSPYWVDVEAFTTALKSPSPQISVEHLNEAIALYRGDFLAGFHVSKAETFEEWAVMQREHLYDLLIQGLDNLAQQCLEQQEYALGLTVTKRLLALEPWREITHQQQMLFLTYTGQRHAALIQYETCCRLLADELDISPMAETTALYEQLKSGQLHSPLKTLLSEIVAPVVGDLSSSCVLILSDELRNVNGVAQQPLCPQVDWGPAPIQTPFYGRQTELDRLAQWVMPDRCRLVAIFGMGGHGKTALAVQLTAALGQSVGGNGFNYIIWRSLRNAPPFPLLLQDWLLAMTGPAPAPLPDHVDDQMALLLKHLRQQRCLLILDDFNRLLQDNGQFRPSAEAYEQLLAWIARAEHQSCLLLTSRAQPREFQHLAIDSAKVRSWSLTGLSLETGREILQALGLAGSQEATAALIRRYSGNPLALKLASMTIQNFFEGNIDHFMQENTLIFADIQTVLEQQLAPLSPLAQKIMNRLAREQSSVTFQTLWNYVAPFTSKREFLEALHALQRQCLLEKYEDGFAIQNLIAEYLTAGSD